MSDRQAIRLLNRRADLISMALAPNEVSTKLKLPLPACDCDEHKDVDVCAADDIDVDVCGMYGG